MFSLKAWLQKPIHFSFLLAYFASGFLGGILLSANNENTLGSTYFLVSFIIFIGVIIFQKRWMITLMILAGLICGMVRGSWEIQAYKSYDVLYDTDISLQGKIAEDIQKTKNHRYALVLTDIEIDSRQYAGQVWIETRQADRLQRSDTVVLEGSLQKGFGPYAAAVYSADILAVKKGDDVARDMRDIFSRAVRQHIHEPHASLGLGIVTGQQSLLSLEFEEQLKIAGLTHIVVASGYNLTILVRLSRRFFEGISKYLTLLSGGSLIGGFILVTGFSPSMTRAGLVAGLSLLAWYYGRRFNPFVLLILVAATTVLINPMYIWSDVGWYLSFAAFFGVMIVAPLLQHYFFGEEKPTFIRQVLGETLSALVMTAPIIALLFSSYATYALLANILVVPLIPLVMITVFLSGTASMIAFGVVASLPAELLLSYVVIITEWIAGLPGSIINLYITPILVVAYYTLIAISLFYMGYKTKHNFRNDNLVE